MSYSMPIPIPTAAKSMPCANALRNSRAFESGKHQRHEADLVSLASFSLLLVRLDGNNIPTISLLLAVRPTGPIAAGLTRRASWQRMRCRVLVRLYGLPPLLWGRLSIASAYGAAFSK